MKIFVYLDESGSIHKNSSTKYFAVGGYFVYEEDRLKVTSLYKKINKAIKTERHIKLDKEIKSIHMKDYDKVRFFTNIQDINTFCGCVKVFEKCSMRKEIIESNIFFNYAVKLIFKDCIIPLIKLKKRDERVEFVISADNRNLSVKDLLNLEVYLKLEFCSYNFDFDVTYYDSKYNFGVQMADLIVNTFYNYYKNIDVIKMVLPALKLKKFRVSLFPGGRSFGRTYKL